MIKKYPWLWGGLIGLLVLLNFWRWIPKSSSYTTGSKYGEGRDVKLHIPEMVPTEDKVPHRDLFTMGAKDPSAPHTALAKVVKVTLLANPTATPIPVAADGSVMEAVGGYRLMGTLSRQGVPQALIEKGTQSFQVGLNDSLEGQYKVKDITDDEVYLTETQTGNTLKLRIWSSGENAELWKK